MLLVLLYVSHSSASEYAPHSEYTPRCGDSSCSCHRAGGMGQGKARDAQRGTQGEADSQGSAWISGMEAGNQAKKGNWGVDIGNWLPQSDVRADPPARLPLRK